MRHTLTAFTALVSFAGAGIAVCGAARAADNAPVPVEARVDRLEKEMRAVQRKVFPTGAPVQPDIVTAAPSAPPELPSSTPVSDLIARVTTLESQIATITGQVEQNSYKLRQIEDELAKMKAQAAPPAVDETAAIGASPPASLPTPKPAPKPVAGAPKAAPTEAGEKRKAAVAAIERPSGGDAAGDAYAYGFRLWSAKFYPEAQAQLKATVDKYGDSAFGSRAANLLGRAYLDDGKPALASVAFYENYQKRPSGDRAAQSLTYLGEALIQLKKPKDACKVYSELEGAYGASLSSDLRDMMEKGRVRAKCGA